MSNKCPGCAVTNAGSLLEALSLGVALGRAFGSINDMMCTDHRTPYVMAMMRQVQVMAADFPETAPTGSVTLDE